ncbi:MAG TPA: hypothetical protein QF564_32210 [Pirellulaceae bacterium]|jgi:hypothetical protein|nr:hypothetical protein [Pirellulaceae bacterium]
MKSSPDYNPEFLESRIEAESAAAGIPTIGTASFFTVDLTKLTGLKRTAIGKYIELAGIVKTKPGVRDRKFTLAETMAIVKAVADNTLKSSARKKTFESLKHPS